MKEITAAEITAANVDVAGVFVTTLIYFGWSAFVNGNNTVT